MLQPSETQTVEFRLGQDALAYYDTYRRGWLAEAGVFEVLIGSSSRDIRATGSFALRSSGFTPSGDKERGTTKLSIDSTIGDLLANEEATV
jgi:beta-glucosidase